MTGSAILSRAPGDLFCVREDGPRTWGDLFADVARVRPALAGHDAICNLASRRYDFAVFLLAALANGQSTILPPSRAEGAVSASLAERPNALRVDRLEDVRSGRDAASVPLADLPGEVLVFTSGSTGAPIPHRKLAHTLSEGARLTSEIVARAGLAGARTAIVSTTPHQHMYGLESAIFGTIAQGLCLNDTNVFYPSDLEAAVAAICAAGIEQVVLATSPPHLRVLGEAIRELPAIRCVISATAPLNTDLARDVEADGGPPVYEIYGSTETGALAWRQSAVDEIWTPLDVFSLHPGPEGWFARAPHLPSAIPLGDDIELLEDGTFRLLGRRGDSINIGGKRHSLGALNAALSGVLGLPDGLIVSERGEGDDRLTLFVVMPADGTNREEMRRKVRSHLATLVDPVFLPRRMIAVARIPRGPTGKVSAADAARLLAEASGAGPERETGQR